MAEIATASGTRRLLRKAGWPTAVVAASTCLGLLLLPYANTLVAVLLPNALAIALLLTVAVINERHRVEARRQRAEGEWRAAESRARAAEACLLDAIDSLNEGFALFDPDDRLVLSNRKYRDLYAISADLLQTGARFEDLIREGAKRGQYVEAMGRVETWVAERLAQHRNPVATVLQQLGDGRWVLIREHRTQDGGTVGVWTDVSRLKNQELLLRDREQRLERTIEDLGESRGQMKQLTTEMTRLARENAAHRERAEASNAAKSQFLANVSHELRTPLNAILGFSEILKTKLFGPLGAPQYESYVCDIHESGVLLLNLINDLLDLSKIEAGKFVLQEDICDVLDIAEAAVRVMAERAEKAGVTLEQDFQALPPIRADERKIKQIMLNLLSNAVKFTPQGGSVRFAAGVDGAGGVTFTVADTGIGIAPHQLERVLEPFGQVENIMTRSHAGTGLGLPLCKALAELHGGTLALESEVGSGTTVTIVLPKDRSLPCSPGSRASAA